MPESLYPKDADASALMDRTLGAVRGIPGVTAAGATTTIPWGGSHSDSVILAEGYIMKPGESVISPEQVTVTPLDPLVMSAVIFTLAAGGLAACALPARRATRLDL